MTMTPADDVDIDALAASLRPIDPAYTKASAPHRRRHWYQGQEAYLDLMVELEEDAIVWIQFTWRGRVLTWHQKGNRLTTGKTEEMVVPSLVAYYPASKTITCEAPFDADWARMAAQILGHRLTDPLCLEVAALIEQAIAAEEVGSG